MRPKHGAFTLIEVLAVIAVIAMLSGLLIPVFAHALRAPANSVCASNLRQLWVAGEAYSDDFDDGLVPSRNGWDISGANGVNLNRDVHEWAVRQDPRNLVNLLRPYVKQEAVFHCPADKGVMLNQDFFKDDRPYVAWERFGTSYRQSGELQGVLGLCQVPLF